MLERASSVRQATARAPVRVRLPAALLALFPEAERRFDAEAESVAELVDLLDRRWPGMRDRLCDSTPAIRRHINIFVAGERAALQTRLPPGVEVFIFTAMSGG